MKEKPLVSVIVPTLNSAETLERCLKSIKSQSYKNLEIIVVDNYSTDSTPDIAKKYADFFFQKGPERSAQVNFGVSKAKGEYVYKVDSDFVLDKDVVKECIDKTQEGYQAVVVHNPPDIRISRVAKLRKFEVDMYKYDLDHSSARFLSKALFKKIGGFNSKITAGEDYDFQNKLNREGVKTGFVDAEAQHLGEPKTFRKHLLKYYAYGKDFVNYKDHSTQHESGTQLGFVRKVYIRNWRKFIHHPIQGTEFIIYHTVKYFFGALGYSVAKIQHRLHGKI